MSEFDPYYKWLGIPPAEQPPDHYRLLGITQFESDADVISSAADRQMSFVRQQGSGAYASHAQKLLNELAAARLCLLSPDKRQKYEANLRRADSASSPVALEDPVDEPPPQIKVARPAKNSRPDVSRPKVKPREQAAANLQKQMPLIIGAAGAFFVTLIVVVYAASRPSRPVTVEKPKAAAERVETVGTNQPSKPETPVENQPRVAKPAEPKPAAEIDLLANVDPKRDAVRGTWELQNGELRVVSRDAADLLQFRDAVPDEYQFEFDVRSSEPKTSINVGLKAGARVVCPTLDGWSGEMSGMTTVNGQMGHANETTWRGGALLVPGRWSHVVCQVRKNSILVQCDGKTIIAWQGDLSRLSKNPFMQEHDQQHLYLASWQRPIAFRAVKLRPLTPAESAAALPARAPTGQASPAPMNSNGPNPPGARAIDYGFERQFAQKMIDKGAHELSLKGENSGYGGNIRNLPEWPFYLEALHIRDLNSTISDADLEDADRLHGLERLHVDSQRVTDAGFTKLTAAGKVRTLTLGPGPISANALQRLRQLENLNLIAPSALDSMLAATQALPNLRGLAIEYPQQTVADLSPLKRLPGLHRLRFDRITLNAQGLAVIGRCQELGSLDLRDVRFEAADSTALPAMPKLQMLICQRTTLPLDVFRQFVTAAPQMGFIEIYEAPLDSEGWKLLPRLQNLKQLQLMQTSIRDEDLQYLPASLQQLNLFRASITGEGFQKLASGLPELQQINLSLTSLNEAGLAQLLRSTPHLKRLFVQQTKLSPEAFKLMAAQPELEEIAMEGVADPDACLLNLRSAPALKLVRAQGRFSAEAKAEFLKARPNCQLQ